MGIITLYNFGGINMNIKDLIENAKSTRDFKEKKVSEELVKEIISFGKESKPLFTDQRIQMMYLEDGNMVNEALDGIAGFHGIMIKAPQYFLFVTDNKEHDQVNVGYYVQKIVLKIHDLGLDSCWINVAVDGQVVKEALSIDIEGEPAAILAIGYDQDEKKVINQFKWGENYSKTSMKVVENNVSPRLSMTEVVYFDKWGKTENLDQFMELGMEEVFRYVVMAPSSFNRQPWRFLLKGNHLYLAIKEDEKANEELDLLDAGVVMLYVELLFNENSMNGTWKIEIEGNRKEAIQIPQDYKYIGYFSTKQ